MRAGREVAKGSGVLEMRRAVLRGKAVVSPDGEDVKRYQKKEEETFRGDSPLGRGGRSPV